MAEEAGSTITTIYPMVAENGTIDIDPQDIITEDTKVEY